MKRVLISAAVLSLAIAGVSQASAAPSGEKVTGGGQTLVGATGAGNTIAFTAQDNATDGPKGQVQFVDRSTGTGQAQRVMHGVVTCLDVITPGDGGTARIGGYFDRDTTKTFTIDVTDGGEGGAAAADMISLRQGDASDADDDGDATCTDRGDFRSGVELARGNVQVHKAK